MAPKKPYRVHSLLRRSPEPATAPSSTSALPSALEGSRKRKFSQYCESEPFKFVVGTTKTVFYIHRAILSDHSGPLDALVNGSMEESQKGVAHLADVDAETFALFAQFAYTATYDTCKDWDSIRVAIKDEEITDILILNAKVFLFADCYVMPRLLSKSTTYMIQILGHLYQAFKPEAAADMRRKSLQAVTTFIRFCFNKDEKCPEALKAVVVKWLVDSSLYLGKVEELHDILDSSLELASALCKTLLKLRAM